MLKEEGYTSEEIKKIIQRNDDRYKTLTERALCRLFCQGSGDNAVSLLPWCFDKIRQFVKERKVYGYWISYLELRNNPDKASLKSAFAKWQLASGERSDKLSKLKFRELGKFDKANVEIITEQAEEMQGKHAIIDDIKEQRTFLIGKVISAQRLALARCNFSYKYAKEKAWARLVRNTLLDMRD